MKSEIPKAATYLKKGVTYNSANNAIVDCLFCRIIKGSEPASMIDPSTPDLVAFKTINPATNYHILITPRKHISNAGALMTGCAEDIALLENMKQYGKSLLTEEQRKDALFCFHMPPWNSIDHLHLHVIANRSTMSFWNGFFKYLPGTNWCTDVDSLINKLKNDAP